MKTSKMLLVATCFLVVSIFASGCSSRPDATQTYGSLKATPSTTPRIPEAQRLAKINARKAANGDPPIH